MNRTCKPLIKALLAGTALTQPAALVAGELPHGASTVYGGVGIATPSANQMTIQQTTPTAIVNWQGFSVGAGARVDISQPSASSALLNRVTGSATSTIAGQINANGQVYLVNPNGIAITPTGTVNAGGFVASSLDIADQDFVAGRRIFRGSGQSAAVSNAGTIAIQQGGYAALLGGRVENSGVISVPMGRVGLGAGEQATLDLSGDGFLQVAIPSKGDGSDAALIRHSGRISATGGRVEMQAATAREAARNAINLSGLVEARSVSGRNGAIVLGGGEGGTVTVSGRLNASARGAARQAAAKPARGGTITVTGSDVRLNGATLSADGTAGGGTIRVGGGFQGQGPLQRAATTTVDAGTTISANAGRTGNGGDIVVWSDRFTDFAGRISATGGTQGGNGGQAEVSGKAQLAYTGTTVLTAANGAFGTLLLDPYNVTISSGTDANQTGFAATGNDSVINATTLQNALATANVTVTTGGAGSPGTQAGDITVAAPVTWGTGAGGARTTLTLSAYRSIAVNANLTVSGSGDLVLNTNQGGTGGTLTFGPGASASFTGTVPPTARSLVIDTLPYTILGSQTDLLGALSTQAGAAGRYALATNVDVTGIPFTRPLNTSQPSSTAPNGADIPFTGTFNGLGHTINGLSITSPNQYVGLFGTVNGGTIANLNLTNVNIRSTYGGTGASYVGGLVGLANNATLFGVSVSGAVANATANTASFTATGGLAGTSSGTVTRSVANVAVTGGGSTGSSSTGGLIGENNSTVSQSFATGAVSANGAAGFNDVGGLIGTNGGAVTQSYATGAVTGGNSSATGEAGTVGVGSFTGGLIGFGGGGNLDQVYATGQVRGGNGPTSNSYTGGLVGYGTSPVARAYATGAVTGGASSNAFTGSLIGYQTGTVTQSYGVGAVTAGTGASVVTGGLFGFSNGTGVTASFWDTTTTGQTAASGNTPTLTGATGLTTAQFQDPAAFVQTASAQGWNFQTTWAPPSAGFYPELYSTARVIAVTADPQTRAFGAANPPLTGTVFGGPGTNAFDTSTTQPSAASLLTTTATQASPAGDYPISPIAGTFVSIGGVTYRVAGTGSTLTVTPGQAAQDRPAEASAIANATVTPNTTTFLPNFTTPALTLPDAVATLTIGGGGPTIGPAQGSQDGGGSSTRAGAQNTLAAVQRAANTLEGKLAACDRSNNAGLRGTTTCYSNALDGFADTLEIQVQQLPPAFRSLPAVIRQAARQVRAATTVAEARAAVRVAVVAVRKAISLLRADEPAVARLQVRQGNAIASALRTVDNRLSRAVGL